MKWWQASKRWNTGYFYIHQLHRTLFLKKKKKKKWCTHSWLLNNVRSEILFLKLNTWHFEKNPSHLTQPWKPSSICATLSSQMILPGDKKDCCASEPDSCRNQLHIPRCLVLLPYNIQRPFLKDCLWGFFSVNVIPLQTSLWKCHPATLFISSPALFSIIHLFPLEGSHTQDEALLKLYVLKCDCKTEGTAARDVLALGCYGLMLFAQPWSPVIEDSPPLPTLHCCRGVEGRASRQSCL